VPRVAAGALAAVASGLTWPLVPRGGARRHRLVRLGCALTRREVPGAIAIGRHQRHRSLHRSDVAFPAELRRARQMVVPGVAENLRETPASLRAQRSPVWGLWPCPRGGIRRAIPPRRCSIRSSGTITRRSAPRRRGCGTGRDCRGSWRTSFRRSCGVDGRQVALRGSGAPGVEKSGCWRSRAKDGGSVRRDALQRG
jgi:hypothetical protein